MGIFEVGMIFFIPTGTLLLNAWRKKIGNARGWHYGVYVLVSIAMATAPLLYVRSIEPNHTVLGVVLAGVGFFWFAIVGARNANT
ncbi:hypothetical protein [Porticoccus sp.]|jgi:hypothetical protein|uniref:hypothetical protein n=1 Tax=Porticoccus sp. TaxID=2024853 RepID=UPI000C64F06E|nr:hypothetical protein [Porticoccus sp.]MAZ69461.1 hypothetical protein [Porticoccus sp.]|tara:strand:- start:852 stop:1106 length:255 start_codon:yes stop_codon:yes gene_type:complete